MMKRILLLAVLALSLIMATPALAQEKKKITIGSTVYYMTEFITLMVEGMQAEADDLGVELIVLDANNDAATQLSQVENLIAKKVDVILVAAVDADAIVPALDMAEAAGIPLTGVNMLMNTDKKYYYAGPNDVEAGELEAQYIIDKIGGKGNVVILEGPIGTSAQLQRLEGNMNVLKKNPDVKILAQKPANWNREEALTLTENWLQTYPDQIDGIIAHNDEMALGAIQALEAKGLKDQIPVAAVDAIKDACQAIKDGRMEATVFQDAALEGRLGVRVAHQVATGNPPAEALNFIKMELITKDNVDKLLTTIYK
jgi:ribose transport system substrate-binding protein/inositol transport system substrate-binding protein